jgi:hypothetical protein
MSIDINREKEIKINEIATLTNTFEVFYKYDKIVQAKDVMKKIMNLINKL